MIAAIRPNAWDFPLFLHVTGAILLFGVIAATFALSLSGSRRPDAAILARSTFWALLVAAVPAWLIMRVGAQWIYSKEHYSGHGDPSWLGVGFGVSDAGLLVLLILLGVAFRWTRKPAAWQPRVVAGLSGLYLVLLTIAWLAMSGKWS